MVVIRSDGGSLIAPSNTEAKAPTSSQGTRSAAPAPVHVPSSPTEDKVFTLGERPPPPGGPQTCQAVSLMASDWIEIEALIFADFAQREVELQCIIQAALTGPEATAWKLGQYFLSCCLSCGILGCGRCVHLNTSPNIHSSLS